MNRQSREILFNIPLSAEEFYALDQANPRSPRSLLRASNAAAVDAIEQHLGRPVQLHHVTVGRGASNVGIAIELLEPISLVGGASATFVGAARLVRACYRKFARRIGERPLISLGAAEHLALADLVDRAGGEPRVFGSGEMYSGPGDRNFTGGDAFFVVLATDSELHHYHVTAYGETHYIGTSPLVPHFMDIYEAPVLTEDEDQED